MDDSKIFLNQGNPYLPHIMKIEKVIVETPTIKTFHFNFKDEKLRQEFTFKSGQFAEYSIFGSGECTFCVSSSPTRKDHMEFSVMKAGRVTGEIHNLEEGDEIGFRGPFGNCFPIDDLKGKNLVFIGGGIGLAPLRSLIWNVFDNRNEYRDITIIYGARSPNDLSFKYDLKAWEEEKTINMVTTVDRGDESWTGKVGLVPHVLEEINPSPENSVAITCGPPIMIKFTLQSLEKLKFTPKQIITTLEMRMKCGIGKCGRCNIGNIYVCKDGPVFTYEQIQNFLSQEF
ncbi:MAG: FAD/NAD(P)-binding protein [Thermodesulfobacteriota bacterium]|nr:FAD/NAD(P)-binding protein [Thermodesulfobacteriota bacterium]